MYYPFLFYYGQVQPQPAFFPDPNFLPLPLPTLSHNWLSFTEMAPVKMENEVCLAEPCSSPVKKEETEVQAEPERVSRFKYAKKNVESNVVNQVLSYITTKTKSQKVLMRLMRSKEKVDLFYEIMK